MPALNIECQHRTIRVPRGTDGRIACKIYSVSFDFLLFCVIYFNKELRMFKKSAQSALLVWLQ